MTDLAAEGPIDPENLTDDDIARLKAEFMASDPAVTFVVDDEP